MSDMTIEEAKQSITRIGKGLLMERAMESKIGAVLLDFENRGGWRAYENDDGSQRYDDAWKCLRAELPRQVDVGERQVRRLVAAAVAEGNIFGESIEMDRPDKGSLFPYDTMMKRPALPERTLRELARLNDSPADQKKAFAKVMEATNGNPTAKVAAQVVDTFTGDFQRNKAANKRERVQDAKLRVRVGLLVAAMESNLRLLGDSDAPDWVKAPMEKATAVVEEWYELISQ